MVDKVNKTTGRAPHDALDAMHTIMHAYRSLQLHRLRVDAADLPHMEFKALGFFARHPGATQSELVAHSGRDKAQVARLVAALRDRGLLAAHEHPTDRRITCLRLSDEGEALHAALRRHDDRLREQVLAVLTDEEQATLSSLLEKVQHSLRAMDVEA